MKRISRQGKEETDTVGEQDEWTEKLMERQNKDKHQSKATYIISFRTFLG